MKRRRIGFMAQVGLLGLVFIALVRPAIGQGQNVRMVGQIGGGSKAIAMSGRYAYLGDGSHLVILDGQSSPPLRLGSLALPDLIEDIKVAGAMAYVAAGNSGLHIVNVSDPTSPVLRGTFDTPGSAMAVFIVGTMAYVADWVSGLLIIDVSNPSTPKLRSSIEVATYPIGFAPHAYDVFVANGMAYVADHVALAIHDVRNPDAPVTKGWYRRNSEEVFSVYVAGNLAYTSRWYGLSQNTGIQIVNVTDPTSPTFRGEWAGYREPYGIQVSGSRAYIANGEKGLAILDVTNPSSPILRGTYKPTTPYRVEDVVVTGTLVFAAVEANERINNHAGLDILNVANPTTPTLRTSYETVGIVKSMQIVGGYAYFAGDWNDLQIVDIRNPRNPRLVGFFNWPYAGCEDLAVSNGRAYLALSGGGMIVVDVRNPAAPVFLARQSSYHRAVVLGNTAYESYNTMFRVLNVADATNFQVLGSLNGHGGKPFVAGGKAYLADRANGLHIIDVSVPSAPQYRGTYNTPGEAWDVAVTGNVAYIADDLAGIQVVNVSDPTSPGLVRSITGLGSVRSVNVSSGKLYVCASGISGPIPEPPRGVLVYDISNLSQPKHIGTFSMSYPTDVLAVGGLIYAGDYTDGLWILESAAGAPRLQAATVVEKNGNGIVEQYDELILTMDKSVSITPDRIFPYHFFTAVAGDDIGGSLFQAAANPYNSRQIVLTLGYGPRLKVPGVFSMANRTSGAPSGIDLATFFPQGLVTGTNGLSAVDGGALGVNDSGVDIQYTLLEHEEGIGSAGGTVAVVNSPDAAYTRHELAVPAGALTQTTRLRLAPAPRSLGVTDALQIRSSQSGLTFATSASLRVQYRDSDIDRELGHVEGEMCVHQLVEKPAGVFQYVPVPGKHTVDTSKKQAIAPLKTLNPCGSVGTIGVFAGLPIETVDERTISIKPGGGGMSKGAAPVALVPGSRGAYTLHKIEFPGYVLATGTESTRLVVTIRTATLAERFSQSGGQSFPSGSGAAFVVTVEDATGRPVEFKDPVHVTVQFKTRDDWSLSDCVRFTGQQSPLQNMRLAYDKLPGEEVAFEFVSQSPHVVNASEGTVRVANVAGLTGSDGKGVFGAVAHSYLTPSDHWPLYR